MLKITLLDAKTLGEVPNLDDLRALGDLEVYETTTPDQTRERISDSDIVISNKVHLGREVLEGLDSLKLICVAATGMNNVDQDFAKEKGIAVKNVVGYSTDSVAQVTFSLLLYLLNQTRYYADYVRTGQYSQSDIFTHLGRPFWEIKGKRFGIIGLGTIGKQVARIAEAFGAEVVYYSTSGRHDDPDYQRVKELNEFLATADIVSVHAPLNEHTQDLLDYGQLQKMKPTALLLNTGRGGIIREADLVRALNEGLIAGAGLDVMETEPLPADSVLLTVQDPEKLVLTPHIAWSSIEARTLLVERVRQNIETFLTETGN